MKISLKNFVLCLFLVPLLLPTVYASSQGFTVTSVSLSNILHPGEPETNVQWLVQISLNGGGQSLVGTLDKKDINYQGFTSVYPLQIGGSTDSEQAFYIINNNQPQPIVTYTASVQKGTLTSACLLGICHYDATPPSSCPSNAIGEWNMKIPSNGLWGVPANTVLGRVCFFSQQVGIKATIPPTPNIQFSSHLNLMANGKQESLDLSYSQQSATSSGNLVQANWVGSLVTGNAPPSGSDYVAIGTTQENNWIVKSAIDFDSYKTVSNNFILSQQYSAESVPTQCSNTVVFPGGSMLGGQDLQPYINNYMTCLQGIAENQFSIVNREANELITNDAVSIGGKPTQLTYNNGQPAFVINIPDYFVTNPVVVLRFRGDFLGVVIPLGKPKILSATSDCFNSGNKGEIKVSVQNIGNAEGSFYPDLTDCKMIDSQSPPKYSVGVNQIQNIEIPIFSTGVNANLKQNCIVKVTDYNGGGTDTASISICIKEANQCELNKPVVQGKSICPCKDIDGTYKPATGNECTYCEYGIIVDESGEYKCGAAPLKPTGSNVIENNSEINDAILQFGSDTTGNILIPIALGSLKGQLKLGSHAEEAAKSSNIAFPNGATQILKIGLSALGNIGCASGAAYVGGQSGGLATALATTGYGMCTDFVNKIIGG